MKELLVKIYNKYKKLVIIGGIGLGLIILGLLSWKLVFVKYKEFYQEEKKFTNAAKRYYEYHQRFLPKDGESKDLTLQDLYDLDMIDDLYVPNTRKTCDTASWVRVFKDKDGEYKYVTYLKCGRYSSRVDHTGPEITLKGDLKIDLALNSEYKELGVVSVKDNKDGKMDVKDVVIDSSKVNTKKIGTYPVTYTIKDSKRNKTVVTREINVIQGLTDTVKAGVAGDGFYKGNVNNYVLFSGMLWRIVKVNEDGTIKLILNDSVTNLRFNHKEYKNSNIDTWLTNVFYNALKDNKSTKYLVKSKYCVGDIVSMNDYSGYCSKSLKRYVGLLDIDEYKKTFGASTSSVLGKYFALGHKIGDNYAEGNYFELSPNGVSTAILSPIRPVITINNDMKILSGNGTIKDPYKLNDYDYAKKKAMINTRLVGEYIEYSGILFKIIGKDSNDNLRIIMENEWKVQPGNRTLYLETEGIDTWNFDPKDENTIAYTLNNDALDYIDTKNVVETEYEIPTNDPQKKYTEYKYKKVKAKILLPKTYELFAASANNEYMYLYMDKSTNDQLIFAPNALNDRVFELNKTDYGSYAIKALITIKGNLKIESGNGTINNPYKLK